MLEMLTDRDVCMAALLRRKPLRDIRVADAMSGEARLCRPSHRAAETERVAVAATMMRPRPTA